MDQDRLALKYRPRLFDEVKGQDYAKRLLSQLIVNGKSCANILLHGSIGSGKTSLIRIYAKALNCEKPSSQGEPCLGCTFCKQIEKGDESSYAELDTPRFRKVNEFKAEVDRLLGLDMKPNQRRVIFFDEAHTLSLYRDSFDYLLKKVEEPPEGIAFCFATTAIDRISAALRSRVISSETKPLTHELSIEFLGPIATEVGLAFTPEALSLLAGLGEHQPRNMLQALDQMRLVSNDAEITRERVAQIFGVDYIDRLIDYFDALGSGVLQMQVESFFAWPDPVRKKVRLIQLLLIAIYYQDLSFVKVSVESVIASIRRPERDRILEAFRRRLPDVDLKAFWEDLLNVWPVITSDLSDEALHAAVLRLQTQANRSAA